MITYSVNSVICGTEIVYGISAHINGEQSKTIPEITTNKTHIQKLVSICNELELELCHLEDVVEDYLTDFTI